MSEPQRSNVDPRLETDLAGVSLRTPVLTASGTCGYGREYDGMLDYTRLGGFTTKSITREARPGNDPQRIVEVRAGMLNAIGLANVGLEAFMRDKLPFIERMPTQVFVNVAGHSVEDYVAVVEALDEREAVAGFELNVSCPNVADGLMFGTDAVLLGRLVERVRRSVRRAKLVVKLSPNVTDITEFARAAIDGGADALSMTNTFVGLSLDTKTRRPLLANVSGGLSGPAIRPLALWAVYRVFREVAHRRGVPIIGMGGIQCTNDALEFLIAGASAVAIGTALYLDPTLPVKIAAGISDYLNENNLDRVALLTGSIRLPESACDKSTAARANQ